MKPFLYSIKNIGKASRFAYGCAQPIDGLKSTRNTIIILISIIKNLIVNEFYVVCDIGMLDSIITDIILAINAI